MTPAIHHALQEAGALGTMSVPAVASTERVSARPKGTRATAGQIVMLTAAIVRRITAAAKIAMKNSTAAARTCATAILNADRGPGGDSGPR